MNKDLPFSEDCPELVKEALLRMNDKFSKPPEPIMSQEEFDKLPKFKKVLLTLQHHRLPEYGINSWSIMR